jgi:anti-sigma factor RsiW
LHAAFDSLLEQPVPEDLRRAAMPPAWRRTLLPKVAASLVWLAVGATVGFFARGSVPLTGKPDMSASLPHQAAIAHIVYAPELRHPVEVGADQEAHLVQWLSKRLGSAIVVPKLGAQGFFLVGGRLLPSNKGPAAQIMYQDKAGARLTLYVLQEIGNSETAFRFANEGKVSVFYWLDGPFGYALSGELPREQLLAIAETSYRQLVGR